MGKVMFLKKGEIHTVPKKSGIELSSIAEGSTVYINENGNPVAFYVAKHNYESALNGSGRTLLARKEPHSKQKWAEVINTNYAESFIDSWLNNTYKALFDSTTNEVIGTTKFYYSKGGTSSSAVTTLSRSVFLLSATELGCDYSIANTEGSKLPIASQLIPISQLPQWTRGASTSYFIIMVMESPTSAGQVTFLQSTNDGLLTNILNVRPCFTIPSTTLFDEETLSIVN